MKIGAKLESQGLDQKMLLSLRGVAKGIEHRAASADPANTTFDPSANAAGKCTSPSATSQANGK